MGSKINIHRGTFLEKEELRRMMSFLGERPDVSAVISSSISFGLCSPGGVAGTPFKVTPSTTLGAIDMVGGYVIGKDLKGYKVDDQFEYPIPSDNRYYWLKVSPDLRNYEKGLVQVDSSGTVSGTVNFEGIVRGQSSGVPSCIRFEKEDGSNPINDQVYQIVEVVNSHNLILSSGKKFVPENNLRVIILGSIPMGKKFTPEQLEGLYTFETFKLSLVLETTMGTTPPKHSNEFYVARIRNNGGSVTILDERKEFWSIGGSGGGGGSTQYTFTISPTPTDARVIIDGVTTKSVEALVGKSMTWSVSKPGFITKTGIHVMRSRNEKLNVTLLPDSNPTKRVKITVKTSDGSVNQGMISINAQDTINKSIDSITVQTGTVVQICAKPAPGYKFMGWLKDNSPFNQVPIQDIVATEQTTFIATFAEGSADRYWDFEVVGSEGSPELFSVPTHEGGGEYEGVMVKITDE